MNDKAFRESKAPENGKDDIGKLMEFAERLCISNLEEARRLRDLYRSLEFFPTSPWGSRAGGQLIKRIDPMAISAWECACGQGHMAEALKEYFAEVRATDCHDYGRGYERMDFLFEYGPPVVDWVITNPPFELAEQFARHGFTRARRGVALLQRLTWLETVERHELFFNSPWPLTVLAPYAERVAMTLGYWSPAASTATAYAWFIFQPPDGPRLDARIIPIPPGTRERLARGEDVRRFGPPQKSPAAMPLFEEREP
jgi:hypothetical protein